MSHMSNLKSKQELLKNKQQSATAGDATTHVVSTELGNRVLATALDRTGDFF